MERSSGYGGGGVGGVPVCILGWSANVTLCSVLGLACLGSSYFCLSETTPWFSGDLSLPIFGVLGVFGGKTSNTKLSRTFGVFRASPSLVMNALMAVQFGDGTASGEGW